jgi:protein-S-isoprenylcysteine O-methyltransferase Ste14
MLRWLIRRHRVLITRVFFALVLFIILFSTHIWPEGGWIDTLSESAGYVLLIVAAMGRLWSSIYVGGFKSQKLITEGPYSVTRNPLYVFSFIGAIGFGLAMESFLVIGLLLLFFVLVYSQTVLSEEEKLAGIFQEDYREYSARVPRFIPKFHLFHNVESYQINIPFVNKAFLDAIWFLLAFGLLQMIEYFHHAGYLPVLFRVP